MANAERQYQITNEVLDGRAYPFPGQSHWNINRLSFHSEHIEFALNRRKRNLRALETHIHLCLRIKRDFTSGLILHGNQCNRPVSTVLKGRSRDLVNATGDIVLGIARTLVAMDQVVMELQRRSPLHFDVKFNGLFDA